MEPTIQRLLLSDRELYLGSPGDLAARAHALLLRQKETWPLLREGYAGLEHVQTRTIEMDGFPVRLQWNPARIVSSSAKVDDESIRQRKCFLCPSNLPEEQRGLLYAGDYLVLCNPFPIFEEHFTIPHVTHTPQRIGPSLGTMLDLARSMQTRYMVVYNGPRSGASAPDHLHFQAGEKGFLPLEKDLDRLLASGEVLTGSATSELIAVDAQLRRFLALRSAERDSLIGLYDAVESALARVSGEKGEPMMNILALFDDGVWTLLIFPRAKHRPSMFYAQGDDRVIISPAAVDCGGVLITPVEKDFHRLSALQVGEIFEEAFFSRDLFRRVLKLLVNSIPSH